MFLTYLQQLQEEHVLICSGLFNEYVIRCCDSNTLHDAVSDTGVAEGSVFRIQSALMMNRLMSYDPIRISNLRCNA